MKILDIYTKFGIPPNLQDHLLRVTSIVGFLEKNWIGDEVLEWDEAKKVALLHDVGNIVKFNFDNTQVMGETNNNLDYWKDKQAKIIKKYGSDDHEATYAMLNE
ncbi:MAG: hypothetical protein WCO06_01875 [Candidatus Roizmanbacteria bacterium]